jgi:hypothetical protein
MVLTRSRYDALSLLTVRRLMFSERRNKDVAASTNLIALNESASMKLIE